MPNERFVSFHVDIDSPKKLMNFWGVSDDSFTTEDLDDFYMKAMGRALELFGAHGIEATFFCVGDELEASRAARAMIKEASSRGHEIANHSFSHRFGLSDMEESEIRDEIEKCSDRIKDVTGVTPVGFRSPGYDINNKVISILEKTGFTYDASGFWSMLHLIGSLYHRYLCGNKNIDSGFGRGSFRMPAEAYFPSESDWQRSAPCRKIVEMPLTRTRLLQLPFYSNFHIMTPKLYRSLASSLIRRDHITYLIHLIEFVDLNDGIPKVLSVHPNVGLTVEKKMKIIGEMAKNLTRRYKAVRTDRFIEGFSAKVHKL